MARQAMTVRTVRVPQQLWDDALVTADSRDEVLSEIVRDALTAYVEQERARIERAQKPAM